MAPETHRDSPPFPPLESALLVAELTDAVALRAVEQGDEDAILLLYDRYSWLILSVARHVLNDFAAGEEVVQDVFLNLWNHPSAFNPLRGTLRSWLIAVTRNRAIDYRRRRRNEVELHEGVTPTHQEQCYDVESAQLLDKVKRVMQVMPAEQREVFDLAYFQGLTHTEISGKTGMPLGTVKSRLRLAMGLIRRLLVAQAA